MTGPSRCTDATRAAHPGVAGLLYHPDEMSPSDPQRSPVSAVSCAVCAHHGFSDEPEPRERIGPARLAAGLLQAAFAIGSTALAARLHPDPIDLQPRVLRRG